jgi:hypothetical protein
VPPRTPAAPHRAPAERVRRGGAPQAESGAYLVQRRDTCGVPRADVHIERRRRRKGLRPEPHAVDADGKELARFGEDFSARIWVRLNTHATHVGTFVVHARLGDTLLSVGRRMDIDIHAVIMYIHTIYACVPSIALERESVALGCNVQL